MAHCVEGVASPDSRLRLDCRCGMRRRSMIGLSRKQSCHVNCMPQCKFNIIDSRSCGVAQHCCRPACCPNCLLSYYELGRAANRHGNVPVRMLQVRESCIGELAEDRPVLSVDVATAYVPPANSPSLPRRCRARLFAIEVDFASSICRWTPKRVLAAVEFLQRPCAAGLAS